MNTCSVDDCTATARAKGMCMTHYNKKWHQANRDRSNAGNKAWKEFRYNSPRMVFPDGTEKTTDCSYDTAHKRVRSTRGLAKLYVCPCGNQGRDWAYDHSIDAYTMTDTVVNVTTGRSFKATYSSNPFRYIPMCRSCHVYFDMYNLMPTRIYSGVVVDRIAA